MLIARSILAAGGLVVTVDLPMHTKGLVQNWARTSSFRPTEYLAPTSKDALKELLKNAQAQKKKIRMRGTGHSWSDICHTDSICLDLRSYPVTCELIADSNMVRCSGGLKLKELNSYLNQNNRALSILGSVSEQTVAGAMSTGTHGSGKGYPILSQQIRRLRLLTVDGTERWLSRDKDPDLFSAALVGLGCLGVITEVELACEPAFFLEEIAEPISVEALPNQLFADLESEEYLKYWWMPHTDKVQCFRYRRTNKERTITRVQKFVDEKIINRYVFSSLLAAGRKAPGFIPVFNSF